MGLRHEFRGDQKRHDSPGKLLAAYGISIADRGGMGICHTGRLDDDALLRLGRRTAARIRVVRQTSAARIDIKPAPDATVFSGPRLGGLHHRYCWREAA